MTTDTELPELAPYAAPTEEERDWSGSVVSQNCAHVAAALEARLVGRTFTQVMMWEYNGYERPEARSGCRIDARDRPGTEHGIKWDVNDWKWAASGQRAHIGFSAGNYSLGFSSTLAEQPRFGSGGRARLGEGARSSCFIAFRGMSVEFEELTPEDKIARVLLVIEPRLKHVQKLIDLVKHHELTTATADESTQLLFKRAVENAEWELERG